MPALYYDAAGQPIPCPDPAAGLHIRSRQGATVRTVWPEDAVAFQIGETAQVMSGGVLQATPHCVRAAAAAGVARATFAVFMEPDWREPMEPPAGTPAEDVLRGAHGGLLPRGVPALGTRWAPGQTFGEFTDKTIAAYH